MWQPRRFTTLWASTASYRDSFTFFFYLLRNRSGSVAADLHYTCFPVSVQRFTGEKLKRKCNLCMWQICWSRCRYEYPRPYVTKGPSDTSSWEAHLFAGTLNITTPYYDPSSQIFSLKPCGSPNFVSNGWPVSFFLMVNAAAAWN
jgi:hypothetical protein